MFKLRGPSVSQVLPYYFLATHLQILHSPIHFGSEVLGGVHDSQVGEEGLANMWSYFMDKLHNKIVIFKSTVWPL